jgi:hypothetical protein
MAENIRLDHSSAPGFVASTPRDAADLGARRMVAAGGLMAPGSGLTIPRLEGVPREQQLWHGSEVAARVASTLLKAGIVSAEEWSASDGNPFAFLKRSLDRWGADHSGGEIAAQFQLSVTLSTSLDHFDGRRRDDNTASYLFFLILEPESAGYVVLGPTLRLLEAEHPRLPVTFASLFLGALNRWIRAFDYRDALERVEMLREWYESDTEDDSEIELPDIERSIPACMNRRPLSRRTVERMLPRVRDRVARRLLIRVLDLDQTSRKADRPQLDERTGDILSDSGEALPALLAVFEKRDAIEGQFDEASQAMLELTPEPNLIVPFDGTDEGSVTRAFDVLAVCCETLACSSRLIKMMPGRE